MNSLWPQRKLTRISGPSSFVATLLGSLMVMTGCLALAQAAPSTQPGGLTIHGDVVDAEAKPVASASVLLRQKDSAGAVLTTTDPAGAFSFSALKPGAYELSVEKSGLHGSIDTVLPESQDHTGVHLVLGSSVVQTGTTPSAASMEFADAPKFTVAGVTDWTAVGGHGSDSTLRTSEALARETITLKSQGAENGEARTPAATGHAMAEQQRLLGDSDEKLGDPLAAVHAYERAVQLEPSEQNYFAWGSELLLHRAVWQAQEVFKKGTKAYPKSSRMLTALGTAEFAGDLYNEAAASLCAASDLNPADPAPYMFMGKVQMAAPAPLPCIEPKLAGFAKDQPENAMANYFYAMSILKGREQAPDQGADRHAEALFTKAVAIDPKCSDAYLQLGILSSSQHNTQKAIEFYKQAITANPQLSEAHYRLGVAYDRVGDSARAKEEFTLHDELEQQQAAAIEQQRREVKQFSVIVQGQQATPPLH